mgnify:CR=1 FL=1
MIFSINSGIGGEGTWQVIQPLLAGDIITLHASGQSAGIILTTTGTTTPTSGEWQSVTYANNLYLCNGTNTAQVYTGTGTCSNLTFTGVTLTNLIKQLINKII